MTACGGASTPPAATAPASSAAAAGPTDSATGDDETTAAVAQVSANTASEEEIAAALEGAGVSNADRWAEEVAEYRPYPADDPNLTKLRENLAKYNPGQETTDKIVSALTP
jgi:DNA uptake protein ComE-like DNA-binding protein